MKNKKRLIARIGAVIAVVLMVGALAVPCFAVSYVPPYGRAIADFQEILDPRASNFALWELLSYYNGFGDERFFDFKTLVTGEMDLTYNQKDFSLYRTHWSSDSGTFASVMELDYFVICVYMNGEEYIMDNPVSLVNGVDSTVEVQFTKGTTYETGYYTVRFYDGLSSTPVFSLLYDVTFESYQITGVIRSISAGNFVFTYDEIYDISIAFVPDQLSENVPLGMFVDSLFENNYSYHTYTNFVYSPYDFYQGYSKSYDLGYSDAERFAFDAGYDEGKTDGFNEGYDDGKADGYQQGLLDGEAWDLGYQEAVNNISSGDFGRNFLTGIFSAPLDALERFTLVSWTTADNTVISINLIQILSGIVGLSLFIWFLKMFAGG